MRGHHAVPAEQRDELSDESNDSEYAGGTRQCAVIEHEITEDLQACISCVCGEPASACEPGLFCCLRGARICLRHTGYPFPKTYMYWILLQGNNIRYQSLIMDRSDCQMISI